MKWIIDTSINNGSEIKLISVLNSLNYDYKEFKYIPFMNHDDIIKDLNIDKNEKTICYGSINFIQHIQKIKDLNPGSYANFEKFKCSYYYPILEDILLNYPGILVEWKEFMGWTFNFHKPFFIRPDSGNKLFSGIVTNCNYLFSNIGLYLPGIEPNTKVLISPYVEIEKEWRFFVSSNKVLTGSLYLKNNKHFEESIYDREAYELALKVSEMISPDPIFSVDICKTKSGVYKVLELNSFSCAGLYLCDITKIVKFIEEI